MVKHFGYDRTKPVRELRVCESMRQEEIIFDIATKKRHPVNDADEILSNDEGTEVYAIHHADNGSVNIDFSYAKAVDCRMIPSGWTTQYDFDIFREDAW